jgi:DNA repair exonuclease SbcCD nuclease subunit
MITFHFLNKFLKMKVLVIGDPHFKKDNIPDMTKMCLSIYNVIENKQPDIIVILGDILHTHETIHQEPFSLAIKFLKKLSEYKPTYLLLGNHDLINNQQFCTENHPFIALKYWDNIKIVDSPIVEIICDKKFTFVPYVPNGRFREAIDKVDWKDSACIFAHQEFYGCQMGAKKSTTGDVFEENQLVISGHIHDFQILGNIIYTGTPIQHTFGESDKYVFEFIFSDKNSYNQISLGIPKKKIIRINYCEINDLELEPGNYKIVISGLDAEIKLAMKNKKVLSWIEMEHKVTYKTISSKEQVFTEERIKYSDVLKGIISNNPELMESYIELFGN